MKKDRPPSTNLRKTVPIFKHNAETESFKRPDHPDFHTTEEHKKNQFTGIRKNDMALEYEFWILGEIKKRVHFKELKKDPMALEKAHIELFHMAPAKGSIIP